MSKVDMSSFFKRMKEYRRARNLTQSEVADSLGMSKQAISSWETGNSIPHSSDMPNIARKLNVSLEWLLGDEKYSMDMLTVNPPELTIEQLEEMTAEKYMTRGRKHKTDTDSELYNKHLDLVRESLHLFRDGKISEQTLQMIIALGEKGEK